MARLILDTNVLIRLDRLGADTWEGTESDDIAIASITLAELRHGVLAAPRQPRRKGPSASSRVTAPIAPRTM